MPAKSGVGRRHHGRLSHPHGIGIYSPGLDEKGNSLAGIHVLEELSRKMYLSVF